MTRKIFVLRHGETQYNAERKLQGHCNSSLTRKGIAQAQSVGLTLKRHLKGRNFKVYSSSLGRALQTAHIVCEAISYSVSQIIEEPRLREFSLGDWEQRTIPSLELEYPKLLNDNDWYLRAPESESYDAVRGRLTSWLAEIPESEDVIIVSHGLTGIVLRGLLLDLTYEEVWSQDLPQDAFFVIENGSLTRVNCAVSELVA
ncbi:histidine phosphatase family protein [Vibrio ordalii]|uniref:histidine phosphatase family protein n=1 Tax=Vibrio TaxID=662 RepID=UPI00097E31EF|nr:MULTISPECIES: histidine phosphatase family protein [Vibrio]ASG01766.1 phosphoglycerate mutase [Vibrio anguillarum]MBT2949248.1 histidine phosphatase family protein [Vibrio anguillarum]MCS0350007.1 histidine phosphatase family protein [Vibrio ordalii]